MKGENKCWMCGTQLYVPFEETIHIDGFPSGLCSVCVETDEGKDTVRKGGAIVQKITDLLNKDGELGPGDLNELLNIIKKAAGGEGAAAFDDFKNELFKGKSAREIIDSSMTEVPVEKVIRSIDHYDDMKEKSDLIYEMQVPPDVNLIDSITFPGFSERVFVGGTDDMTMSNVNTDMFSLVESGARTQVLGAFICNVEKSGMFGDNSGPQSFMIIGYEDRAVNLDDAMNRTALAMLLSARSARTAGHEISSQMSLIGHKGNRSYEIMMTLPDMSIPKHLKFVREIMHRAKIGGIVALVDAKVANLNMGNAEEMAKIDIFSDNVSSVRDDPESIDALITVLRSAGRNIVVQAPYKQNPITGCATQWIKMPIIMDLNDEEVIMSSSMGPGGIIPDSLFLPNMEDLL